MIAKIAGQQHVDTLAKDRSRKHAILLKCLSFGHGGDVCLALRLRRPWLRRLLGLLGGLSRFLHDRMCGMTDVWDDG